MTPRPNVMKERLAIKGAYTDACGFYTPSELTVKNREIKEINDEAKNQHRLAVP